MNLKLAAAQRALGFVKNGMAIGLGSGSTASYFTHLLAEKLRIGELSDIRAVPTSEATASQAGALGIPLTSLFDLGAGAGLPCLDLVVDGADEVDPDLNLIKGLGRALLREKIVEIHARKFVVIVDDTKLVPRLGSRGPLPVEIVRYESGATIRWLNTLGLSAVQWLEEDGSPVITDNGNYLALCRFPDGIPDTHALANTLAERPGIVEHGLFLDMADLVVVAAEGGVRVLERSS
jgi:ribose 5-phosphate isomerase A